LVGSGVLVGLIRKAIEAQGWKGTYLLDGFPRSAENIAAWEEDIGSEINVRNLIFFECSEAVMEERLLDRGKTSGRADDNPETIKKRFVTFQNETSPIISKYEKDGIVLKVNA
jgi:adenylate kinase family enzyme